MADGAGTPIKEQFQLTKFLAGKTHAWGVFEDRSGTVRRRFQMDIEGVWQGGTFVLNESFKFDDGTTDFKTWNVTPIDDVSFVATGDNVVGQVRGQLLSGLIKMAYKYRLEIEGRSFVVDYDDRFYRLDENHVINRATLRKWGFRIGELTILFEKPAQEIRARDPATPEDVPRSTASKAA